MAAKKSSRPRISLPMFEKSASPAPKRDAGAASLSVDVVRRKLGGRGVSLEGVGDVVSLRGSGASAVGVVLFSELDSVDVWIDEGIVKRTGRSEIAEYGGSLPDDLLQIARDIRAFAALREGQRVRFVQASTSDEGAIVEKCRFGAIVMRENGSLVGVGFRKISPLVAHVSAPN